MREKIDKARAQQTRLRNILIAMNRRIDGLLKKIESLSSRAKAIFLPMLKDQRAKLQGVHSLLNLHDLSKPGVNTVVAMKEISGLTSQLTQSNRSLDEIETTIQNLSKPVQQARPPMPQSSSQYQVRSADVPTASSLIDLFDEEPTPIATATARRSPVSVVPDPSRWPTAPSGPLKPRTASTVVSQVQPSRKNAATGLSDVHQNQAQLRAADQLLNTKEPGITQRYKQELAKIDDQLVRGERALDSVDNAVNVFVGSDHTHSDEADELIQEELNKQLPKFPGS